ncbi:MAG: carboxylesterase family protein, partial [Planctomycetota bacterium]
MIQSGPAGRRAGRVRAPDSTSGALMRRAARTLFAWAAAACCLLPPAGVRARAGDAPPPPRKPVSFLPTARARGVGAFLVAGPFEEPRKEIERGTPAREGDRAGPDDSWRLEVARPWSTGVALGEGGPRGYLYAQVDLPLDPAGPRYLIFSSSADVSVWIDGKPQAPPQGKERAQVRLGPGTGARTCLVRLTLVGPPALLELHFGRVEAGGRLRRQPTLLRLVDSTPARLGSLFGRALELRLFPAFVREGKTTDVYLLRTGACPEPGGELHAGLAARPPGAVEIIEERGGQVAQPVGFQLASARLRLRPGAGASTAAGFEVEALVTRDGVPFARAVGAGFTAGGVERTAARIEAGAGKLLGRKGAPAGAVAYALLQAEKAGLALSRATGPADSDELRRDIKQAERALALAAEGKDFQAGKTGFMEKAYFSEIDDSAQPYLVYVPTGCRPKANVLWPLVVYLHGYVPSYDKDAWVGEYPELNAVMEAEKCILAVPFGRSNTDFYNVGEEDVLRVIEEMKRAYPVDTRRIYLYGYSMGGLGVWTMLVHYPDRFAAAVILSGQSGHYLWHGISPERFPPWWKHLIDTDSPYGLVENIRHVPVRAYHGSDDYLVVSEHSKQMVRRIKELGGDAEVTLVKGDHWSLFDAVLWKREPVAWMTRHRLPERPPAEFSLVAHHVRYAMAWRTVCLPAQVMRPVELHTERQDETTVFFLRNVRALLGSAGVAGLWPVDLEGEDGASYAEPAHNHGYWVSYDTKLAPDVKGAHEAFIAAFSRCRGPVKEAYRSPFCVVYGTTGSEGARAVLRRNAERFVKEWRDFAKGRPPMYADKEITPEIAKKRNLLLFGTPATNAVTARIADRLPVKWDGRSTRIAGGTYPMTHPEWGGRRGLLFCYPNPESPKRLVVVFSGLYWGSHLSVNHKWDHVPDFILFE